MERIVFASEGATQQKTSLAATGAERRQKTRAGGRRNGGGVCGREFVGYFGNAKCKIFFCLKERSPNKNCNIQG